MRDVFEGGPGRHGLDFRGFWKEEEERTVVDQYALAFGVPKEEVCNERGEERWQEVFIYIR